MVAHASDVFPLEAVGILGGNGGHAYRRIPLPNVLGEKRFLAEPYAQFQALRQLSAEGMELLAVYHSHPAGGVQLSPDDLAFASRLPYLQLVIALGRPDTPAVEIAAYAIEGHVARRILLELTSG